MLEKFLDTVKSNRDMEVFRQINESFYMQKAEELRFMLEQIDELEDRRDKLSDRLTNHYQLIFDNWSKDARWLNRKIVSDSQRSKSVNRE